MYVIFISFSHTHHSLFQSVHTVAALLHNSERLFLSTDQLDIGDTNTPMQGSNFHWDFGEQVHLTVILS